MATEQKTTGLTGEDLQAFPQDNLRRELIDGELIVTAAPAIRHQRVVAYVPFELGLYCRQHGGEALPAPLDVYFSDTNVVEPDILYVRTENMSRYTDRYFDGPPDLVVEVSSPSTRRLELVRKRRLYERFSVAEYWFVDLDADRVEVYRLDEGRYGLPGLFVRGMSLATPQAPGLSMVVDEVLGPPEED